MLQQQRLNSKGEKYVIGPTGAPLTLSDLPPSDTQRWVIRRKAEVVVAVSGGLLSLDEACERYGLTNEEFSGWQKWRRPRRRHTLFHGRADRRHDPDRDRGRRGEHAPHRRGRAT